MTILATIGLFFIIVSVYRRGKRDGIKEAIDYFVTELNRKKIDIEIINDYYNIYDKPKHQIFNKICYLIWRKKSSEKP